MRLSSHALFVLLAAMTQAATASAQTPAAPAGSSAPSTAPPAPSEPPSAAPASGSPPASGAPAASPSTEPAQGATAAPAAAVPAAPATTSVLDKVTADAFADAYYSFNANMPKPAATLYLYGVPGAGAGGNSYRAFDVAQGFALNWIGVNATYAADPIGATIGLRMGPGAIIYSNGTSDATAGLQFVKQAYSTWKPSDKVTLDFGKWDQPFGSEVADSQLNMNYTRSALFWYAQPLWFTGLRADFPVVSQFDFKLFVANGWNETLKVNRSYTFGAQAVLIPADIVTIYLGYVGGPQQPDFAVTTPMGMTTVGDVPNANDHWRHMADLVVDFNPTKQLRFLLNGDYRVETIAGSTDETVYGANLVIKYQVNDPFSVALRGEYFHDENGLVLGTGTKTDFEDGTLSLNYAFASHLAFMMDARYDTASTPNVSGSPGIFQKNATDLTNGQFTATLGVIASTK
jgi:hypothetical protein